MARYSAYSAFLATLGTEIESVDQGQMILQQGVRPAYASRLTAGTVKLVWTELSAEEAIVGLRYRGAVLGVGSTILDIRPVVSVYALSGCHLARIPQDALTRLATSPEFLHDLLRYQFIELTELTRSIATLKTARAQTRLCRFLVESLSRSWGSKRLSRVCRHPLKSLEVAQLLGISPPYLSRLIDDLESKGVVSRNKGWIVVSDLSKLHQMAETTPSTIFEESAVIS